MGDRDFNLKIVQEAPVIKIHRTKEDGIVHEQNFLVREDGRVFEDPHSISHQNFHHLVAHPSNEPIVILAGNEDSDIDPLPCR